MADRVSEVSEAAAVGSANGVTSGRQPHVSPSLELADVTRRFGEVTAVDGFSLQVAPGEVVGLLGHNGAGKTTTVRLLAGLLAADAGRVRVAGLDPIDDGVAVRRHLGVLPSRPVVDDRLTAAANLRFAAEVTGLPREGLEARIAASLEVFDLLDRAEERVEGFSTGMRQRLSLARVLLPEPPVLLLDEPTAALDPVAARQVRRILAELARDARRTVVLCTHDLAEAEALCDRVVVLERGRSVAEGRPAELTASHGSGGLLIEVAHEDLDRARTIVVSGTAQDVEVEGGNRLRVVGVPRERVPAVVGELSAAGVTLYEVRRLDPTLEDVYLALHRNGRA